MLDPGIYGMKVWVAQEISREELLSWNTAFLSILDGDKPMIDYIIDDRIEQSPIMINQSQNLELIMASENITYL
jgi:hypothetical protein